MACLNSSIANEWSSFEISVDQKKKILKNVSVSSYTIVFIIDNNIRYIFLMFSEGSFDTEEWINDYRIFSFAITGKKKTLF